MDKLKLPILLFDSECTLCTRFKQALERLDTQNNINYLPVGTNEVYEQFPDVNLEESQQVLHFIDTNHKIYRGGEIAPVLATQFPGINKIAWLLETQIGQKASEFFFDKVLELRKNSFLTRDCKGCHK